MVSQCVFMVIALKTSRWRKRNAVSSPLPLPKVTTGHCLLSTLEMSLKLSYFSSHMIMLILALQIYYDRGALHHCSLKQTDRLIFEIGSSLLSLIEFPTVNLSWFFEISILRIFMWITWENKLCRHSRHCLRESVQFCKQIFIGLSGAFLDEAPKNEAHKNRYYIGAHAWSNWHSPSKLYNLNEQPFQLMYKFR